MKKLWFLSLILLLILTLAVACEKKADPPAETRDETVSDTPHEIITEIVTVVIPVTEPETTTVTDPETTLPPTENTEAPTDAETDSDKSDNPVSDPQIDDIVAAVIMTEQFDLLGDYHLKTDLSMDLLISIHGVETKVSLNGDISLKQHAGESAALILNIPTQEPYSMVYLDGMLYVAKEDGKYRCPLDEAEQAIIWSELLGGLFPSEEIPEETPDVDSELSNAIISEILSSLLDSMDASVVFENTSLTVDEATGDITITLKGLTQEAQALFDEMLSAMGSTEGPDISDQDLSLVLDLFSAFDMDSLAVSMTVDQDMLLNSVSLTFAMDLENMSGFMDDMAAIPGVSGDVPVTMVTTLTTAIDRGQQEITAPEDADTYEETDWRELFGLYTAEMLGLIPDENQMITLSENPVWFARQCAYIEEHPQEFLEVSLSVTGRAYDFEFYEDGSAAGYLYQVYEDGSPAEDGYLPVMIPAELAKDMTLPQDESTVKVIFTLAPEVYDGYEYYVPTVTAYEFIRGPVAVG